MVTTLIEIPLFFLKFFILVFCNKLHSKKLKKIKVHKNKNKLQLISKQKCNRVKKINDQQEHNTNQTFRAKIFSIETLLFNCGCLISSATNSYIDKKIKIKNCSCMDN